MYIQTFPLCNLQACGSAGELSAVGDEHCSNNWAGHTAHHLWPWIDRNVPWLVRTTQHLPSIIRPDALWSLAEHPHKEVRSRPFVSHYIIVPFAAHHTPVYYSSFSLCKLSEVCFTYIISFKRKLWMVQMQDCERSYGHGSHLEARWVGHFPWQCGHDDQSRSHCEIAEMEYYPLVCGGRLKAPCCTEEVLAAWVFFVNCLGDALKRQFQMFSPLCRTLLV